jgi:branched-subunit amino acid transport protein
VSVDVWVLIGLVALVTAVIKGIGPAAFGGRPLPPRAAALIGLLAPAVLAALVATGVFGQDGRLGVGAEAVGVAVGGVIALRGGSILVCVVAAAAVTAALRAVG